MRCSTIMPRVLAWRSGVGFGLLLLVVLVGLLPAVGGRKAETARVAITPVDSGMRSLAVAGEPLPWFWFARNPDEAPTADMDEVMEMGMATAGKPREARPDKTPRSWLLSWARPAASDEPDADADSEKPLEILTHYGLAMLHAKAQKKMLLLWFYDPRPGEAQSRFETDVLLSDDVRELLERCVVVKLPTDTVIQFQGQPLTLLDHEAFKEMKRGRGLAMIDWSDPSARYYGYVVSVHPFESGRFLSRDHLAVLLNLPGGTLTQRTLIFAVRTHPEQPASTNGAIHAVLVSETESHSLHQARITLQGHHNWETRFHRINSRLPQGMLAQEVCAESWAGEGLFEAARECVHSWRQSSGHWRAVSGRQSYFGYDMKRGRNGVWYATGIFARRN